MPEPSSPCCAEDEMLQKPYSNRKGAATGSANIFFVRLLYVYVFEDDVFRALPMSKVPTCLLERLSNDATEIS